MLISLLIILLVSNAVTLRQDKSILFSRVVIIGLLFTSFIAFNVILTLNIFLIILIGILLFIVTNLRLIIQLYKNYINSLYYLLNRVYISFKWCLNSPPKPHAFASLPLQSGFKQNFPFRGIRSNKFSVVNIIDYIKFPLLIFVTVKLVFIIGLNLLDLKILLPFITALSTYLIFTLKRLDKSDYKVNFKDAFKITFIALIFSLAYFLIIYKLHLDTIAFISINDILCLFFSMGIIKYTLDFNLPYDFNSMSNNKVSNKVILKMEESHNDKISGSSDKVSGNSSEKKPDNQSSRDFNVGTAIIKTYDNFRELNGIDNQLNGFVKQLNELQKDNGFKINIDSYGNMTTDFPNSMNIDKTYDLVKRVGVIDRLFNTQSEKYDSIIRDCFFNKNYCEQQGLRTSAFRRLDSFVSKHEQVKKAFIDATTNK